MPRRSFSRSKGSRRIDVPSADSFTTIGGPMRTRSAVEKRFTHTWHSRRRRISWRIESLDVSTTRESTAPQYGQRIQLPLFRMIVIDWIMYQNRKHDPQKLKIKTSYHGKTIDATGLLS